MKKIRGIVAIDSSRGIGKNNTIPWHFSGDMKFFKNTTTYVQDKNKTNAVVMGRKTFDSLPKGALPNRLNVVISRNKKLKFENVLLYSDIKEAINDLIENDYVETIFIIGGSTIYGQTLSLMDELIVTNINYDYDCDVFFPEIKDLYSVASFIEREDDIWREIVYYKRKRK